MSLLTLTASLYFTESFSLGKREQERNVEEMSSSKPTGGGFDHLNGNLSPMSDKGSPRSASGGSRKKTGSPIPELVTRRKRDGTPTSGRVRPVNPFLAPINLRPVATGAAPPRAEGPAVNVLSSAAARLPNRLRNPNRDPFANALVEEPEIVARPRQAIASALPPVAATAPLPSAPQFADARVKPVAANRSSGGSAPRQPSTSNAEAPTISLGSVLQSLGERASRSLGRAHDREEGPSAAPVAQTPERHRTSTSLQEAGAPTGVLPAGTRAQSQDGRRSSGSIVSLCAQLTVAIAGFSMLCLAAAYYVLPLLVLTTNYPEDHFVREYVHTLTQLQTTYRVPPFSLNESDTRCLYLRVLEDSRDEITRLIRELPPPSADFRQRALRLKQEIRALQMVRHRAKLYARSRDSSLLNHVAFYPLRDAWVYGVVRHGWWDLIVRLFWKPSLGDLARRFHDVAVCIRQSEELPCPSLPFFEEKSEHKLRQTWKEAEAVTAGVPTAAASEHRVVDRESVEFLTHLVEMIKDSSGRSNQWYTDRYCRQRGQEFR